MVNSEPIYCVDRISGQIFEEKVAGANALQFLYKTNLGKVLLESFVKHAPLSYLYGYYQDSPYSKRDIQAFIDEYDIDMSEAILDAQDFVSFNDFFARKLKEGTRPIQGDHTTAIVPGDGRVSVINRIKDQTVFQIKGVQFQLTELLGCNRLAHKYSNGVMVIVRLCPVDYHRFHFPVSGKAGKIKCLGGSYYSVNPWAIQSFPSLFSKNYREFLEVESLEFSDVLLMDVGATMVGKIHQTYSAEAQVSKGDERGYFEFGASTTLALFQKDTIQIDQDLIDNSTKGNETLCQMGQSLGKSLLV